MSLLLLFAGAGPGTIALPTVTTRPPAPGVDPQVMLRTSQDGGKTWGPERWRSAGKLGDYSQRVIWERCGSGREMVFELVMTDPVPWRITGAYLELTVGKY